MKGSCLCGAVRWDTEAQLRPPVACHCTQCRKQSGHYWAATAVPDETLTVAGEVRWYQASPAARRGFCPTCGSFLFWQEIGRGRTSIGCGSVDGPTHLPPERHIFAAFKGDYYAIPEGEAREEGWD